MDLQHRIPTLQAVKNDARVAVIMRACRGCSEIERVWLL